MNNILDTILEVKREEISSLTDARNNPDICGPYFNRSTVSFRRALEDSDTGIIAEFKRKSPSKGWINENADAVTVVKSYRKAGASAVSILTDSMFFGGSAEDLILCRSNVSLPILRKEFIIDPLQVYQSKAMGADVILLIASALTPYKVSNLASVAHSIGLEVLLEIHNEFELGHICPDIDVVGVNNRNLSTFQVSLDNSYGLALKIPEGYTIISESGISDTSAVKNLRKSGYKGFLMGENFMKTSNPGETLAGFIKNL